MKELFQPLHFSSKELIQHSHTEDRGAGYYLSRGWPMQAFHRALAEIAAQREGNEQSTDICESRSFDTDYASGTTTEGEMQTSRNARALAGSFGLGHPQYEPPLVPRTARQTGPPTESRTWGHQWTSLDCRPRSSICPFSLNSSCWPKIRCFVFIATQEISVNPSSPLGPSASDTTRSVQEKRKCTRKKREIKKC